MDFAESKLPQSILSKSIKSSNECGWRQEDILEVIEVARKIQMRVVGGQVQYILPGATCELYWLCYDSSDKEINEDWSQFCDRTASECSEKFNDIIRYTNIKEVAIQSFDLLKNKHDNGIDIDQFKVFVLYFESLD